MKGTSSFRPLLIAVTILLFAATGYTGTVQRKKNTASASMKQTYEARLKADDAKLAAVKKDYEARLKSMQSEFETKIADLQKANDAKIADMQRSSDDRVAAAQKAADDRVASAQKAADDRVASALAQKATDQQKSDTEQKVNALKKALRAVSKLRDATEVGISFMDYGRRVIDVKSEAQEALADAPEGQAKDELTDALSAYEDAHTVWNEVIEYKYYAVVLDKNAQTNGILSKYGFPETKYRGFDVSDVDKKIWLSFVWDAARKHLDNAATLIGS